MTAPACLKYGLTPRLLNARAAASYCGMAVREFCELYPGKAIKGREGPALYDRHHIDAWLDRQNGMTKVKPSPRDLLRGLGNEKHKATAHVD